MSLINWILSRKSVRSFTDQQVTEKTINQLLSAAMQAPSAGNQQPWRFIVLTEKDSLTALADVLPYGQSLRSAPLAIAVCGDLEFEKHPGFWVQDCSAATQNILLAVHSLGLGAVWLGIYPREDRIENTRRVLGAPEEIIPFSIIPIGYPTEAERKVTKPLRYNEDKVHYERW